MPHTSDNVRHLPKVSPTEPPKRKGARRMADISPKILSQLNRGEIESLSLVEILKIDMAKLIHHTLPELGNHPVKAMKAASDQGFMDRTRLAAKLIFEVSGLSLLDKLIQHPSDSLRGWAAGVIASDPTLSLSKRLTLVKPLANDPNPGTRETAWIFLRPHIAAELTHALTLLRPWLDDPLANIRRYAVEITRPRGVWCAHIPALKERPELALPLLEPAKSDSSRYVQNSVANWLNDASKTQPRFVRQLTRTWLKASPTRETAYICKRACRSLNSP